MIVSILQLMGFPMAKPVHSRAGETQPDQPPKTSDTTHGAIEHKQASPARRDKVNAKSGKDTKSKAATAKPKVVSKPAAKPVKAAAKPAVKPVAPTKAAAKPVKAPVKAVEKVKPKPVPAKAAKAAAPAPVKAAKPVAKPAASKKASPPMKPVASQPVPAPVPVAPAVVAQKAGRPSSRLAQLTVPSMAQSVASTAAKASYSQSIPSPVIVPVLPSSIKKDPKLANNWKTKPVAELTDADLMAMPDSEYMNEVQLAAFRLKLSTLKRDILNSAGETTEHLREDTSVVPDPADRATIEEEHALELRTRDRERKLLKKIEQSIARIDAGDYGYCDETGEPIGVGRLLARPTATLSLEAQQRRELKQKMFGD